MRNFRLRSLLSTAVSFFRRNESQLGIFFFALGILWDIFTLGRIDQSTTLIQQGFFLLVIGTMIFCEIIGWKPSSRRVPRLAEMWQMRNLLVHFLFGSLLSSYVLFYLKSASSLSTYLFLGILCTILVVNESPKFHRQNYRIKFGLYTLCLASYWLYLIPILMGKTGWLQFCLSLSLCGICVSAFVFLVRLSNRKRGTPIEEGPERHLAIGSTGILTFFFIFYLFQWIPPVPLALQYIGIYNEIEKQDGRYILLYDRPWWKFWQNDAQSFSSLPGERIYCFFRLFSPTNFQDQIQIRWSKYDSRLGWQTQDVIPLAIVGGRDEGYRGFANKAHHSPGKWRVQIETREGREIGRIGFSVEHLHDSNAVSERSFLREIH